MSRSPFAPRRSAWVDASRSPEQNGPMTGTPELDPGYGPSTATGDDHLNDFVQDSAASYSAFGAARGDRVGRVENVVTLIDAAPVSYTHLRAHETGRNLVCRLLLEK